MLSLDPKKGVSSDKNVHLQLSLEIEILNIHFLILKKFNLKLRDPLNYPPSSSQFTNKSKHFQERKVPTRETKRKQFGSPYVLVQT